MKKIKYYIIFGFVMVTGMISLSYIQNVDAYQPVPTNFVNQGTGLSAEAVEQVVQCQEGHIDCDGNHSCSLGHENCNKDHQNHEKKDHHFHAGRHH